MNPAYMTLDGEVLDVTRLSPVEKEHFERCYAIFASRGDWKKLTELVRGADNPLIGPGRRVSRDVAAHPLYRAVRDLEDRLGILTGNLAPDPGDEPGTDPLDDSLVSITEAAGMKGTTVMAVRKAISRGDLVATTSRPQRVSSRSLAQWSVNVVRQRARAGRNLVTA